MISISLRWSEVFQAGQVALMRTMQNLQRKVAEKYGAEGDSLDYHFRGCLGEIAVAKWANKFWSGSVGDYKARDVERWQVRTIGRASDRLILHPEDGETDPFVLALVVSKSLPEVYLCGWITGAEGKQKQFWVDPGTGRPAFFVPQVALHDITQDPSRS